MISEVVNTLVPINGRLEEIKRFTDQNLNAQIDEALKNIPENHKIAVITYGKFEDGKARVETGAFFNMGEWSFVGTLGKNFPGGWTSEAIIRWSK